MGVGSDHVRRATEFYAGCGKIESRADGVVHLGGVDLADDVEEMIVGHGTRVPGGRRGFAEHATSSL